MKKILFILLFVLVSLRQEENFENKEEDLEMEEFMEGEGEYGEFLLQGGQDQQQQGQDLVALAQTIWEGVKFLFGVSIKVESRDLISEEGFSSFASHTKIQIWKGVTVDNYLKMIDYLLKNVNIEEKKKKDAKEILELMIYIEELNWREVETLSKGRKDLKTTDYYDVFFKKREDGKVDVVKISSKNKMQLSPKLSLVKVTKRVGIFSGSESESIAFTPRGFTAKDYENVYIINRIFVARFLGFYAGLDKDYLKLPKK